jgi:hypothetical protein
MNEASHDEADDGPVNAPVDAPDEFDPRDAQLLNEPRYATQSVIAGAIALPLAPLVVGFIPAAIGLHAGLTHQRYRRGHRLRMALGLFLSGLAAILSAGSAIAWGGILLGILLQRSAIEQARQWAGITPEPWSVVDLDGTNRTSAALLGRIVLIDVTSPHSPYAPAATEAIGSFARKHPEIVAFSWCPACTEEEARAYRATSGSPLPIAIGIAGMTEPLTLIPAMPSLVVLDERGAIRLIAPGIFGEAELAAALTAPTPEPRGLLGVPTEAARPAPPIGEAPQRGAPAPPATP